MIKNSYSSQEKKKGRKNKSLIWKYNLDTAAAHICWKNEIKFLFRESWTALLSIIKVRVASDSRGRTRCTNLRHIQKERKTTGTQVRAHEVKSRVHNCSLNLYKFAAPGTSGAT